MPTQVIPVLRSFDAAKAREFYLDWLGFQLDWQHGGADTPSYWQISRAGVLLHLSAHHGDACPGAKVLIECAGLKDFHRSLLAKQYKYNRPGLETEEWRAQTVTVHDPFGNRLVFFERLDD
jgi:catechol 2,3-dioxygenase-like lactoylglutathione lyase family enzyme